MWTFLATNILRYRVGLLIMLGILTGLMGYKASQIQLSYDFAKVLPDDDPDYKDYVKFKQLFGEDGSVMVVGLEDKELYSRAKYNDWITLSAMIRKMDGIEEVISAGRLFDVIRNDSLRKFEFKPLVSGTFATQAEVDSIRNRIHELPFYQDLIYSKDHDGSLIAITFNKQKLNSKGRIAVVNEIKQVCDAFAAKYSVEMHYSGLPYIRTALTKKVTSEMILFILLALLVSAIILLVFFRSFNAVFFSVVVVLVGVLWSFATISLLGYKITILTGLIPPLLIVIGIPNSIFLLNKYQQEYLKHGNKVKALSRAIQRVGPTLFFANVTTSIGFGVFYFTKSTILQEFGLAACITVMATYAVSLILIPIVFCYLPPPSLKHVKHHESKLTQGILEHVSHWVVYKRTWIYSIVGLVIVLSLIGFSKLHSIGYVVDDLPEKDPIYKDIKFFESRIKGVLPMEFAIDTRKRSGVLSPKTLTKMNRLHKLLAKYPEFSKAVSLVDIVKFTNQAYNYGEAKFYILPGLTDLVALTEYASADKSRARSFKSFVDTSGQIARVSVQMADIGSVRMTKLMDELRLRIDSIFPPTDYTVTMTGNSRIFLKGNNYLQSNLKESILWSILLISLLMSAIFMSARMVVISIIPSLIPLLITAGLMGYFGIPLKPSTILIFSIAFGIASDGTIYFLTKYRQELKNTNENISKTVAITISETGVSMLYVAVILFCGFSIFGASEFGGTAALGILISFTLLVAMSSNLILLPSLLLSLEHRLITRAFMKEPLIHVFNEDEDIDLDLLEIKPQDTQ